MANAEMAYMDCEEKIVHLALKLKGMGRALEALFDLNATRADFPDSEDMKDIVGGFGLSLVGYAQDLDLVAKRMDELSLQAKWGPRKTRAKASPKGGARS